MNRGQMILAAGALIVIALIAILLAILQLGYHPSGPSAEHSTPPAETRRVIEEALLEAAPTARDYAWINRSSAAEEVREIVLDRLHALNRTDSTFVRQVEFAPDVAAEELFDFCPRGPGQRFGPCAAIDGLVFQDRGDTTHLVGVVLRITVRHQKGDATITIVVRPLPRVVDASDSDEDTRESGAIPRTHLRKDVTWLFQRGKERPTLPTT